MFTLGQLVATPAALKAIEKSDGNPMEFVVRHLRLEQGNLCDEDYKLNMESIKDGTRILSSFTTSGGDDIWVITEADRSSTTILLPEEY